MTLFPSSQSWLTELYQRILFPLPLIHCIVCSIPQVQVPWLYACHHCHHISSTCPSMPTRLSTPWCLTASSSKRMRRGSHFEFVSKTARHSILPFGICMDMDALPVDWRGHSPAGERTKLVGTTCARAPRCIPPSLFTRLVT